MVKTRVHCSHWRTASPTAGRLRAVTVRFLSAAILLISGQSHVMAQDGGEQPLPSPFDIKAAEMQTASKAAEPDVIILYEAKDIAPADPKPPSSSAQTMPVTEHSMDEFEPVPAEITIDPAANAMQFVPLGRVTFESGKWDLTDTAQKALDTVSVYLTAHPGAARLLLDGHTDWVGGINYNDTLSDQRVTAVENYLTGKGIDPDLIHWRGHGKRAPIDQNWTRLGRGRNRQVELYAVYLPSGG